MWETTAKKEMKEASTAIIEHGESSVNFASPNESSYGSIIANNSTVEQNATVLPSLWTRLPNTAWGICLGLAGHAVMWDKAHETTFLNSRINVLIPNYLFWVAGIVMACFVGTAYLYKFMFQWPLVQAEWKCPARVHFMNGPHLTLMLLTMSVPTPINVSLVTLRALWTVSFAAQVIITQFVYEKWMFSNSSSIRGNVKPQFLLSTVGWFFLAVLGQEADIEEGWGLALPQFCFGAGAVLYLIVVVALFITTTQRLVKRSPVLFLLIAPPSVAVVALDLFDNDPTEFSLAASFTLGWCLVIVVLLIRLGPTIAQRPPVLGAYWAYVFPLSALATATLQYAGTEQSVASQVMAVVFMCLAVLALVIVIVRLVVHSCLVMTGRDQWGDPILSAMMNTEVNDRTEHVETA